MMFLLSFEYNTGNRIHGKNVHSHSGQGSHINEGFEKTAIRCDGLLDSYPGILDVQVDLIDLSHFLRSERRQLKAIIRLLDGVFVCRYAHHLMPSS